jgi:F-type H+-transporting ATPase subunit gamma
VESLESISASLKTTEGIRSIVRTMKSLSAASIHQYESAADAIAEYSDTVDQGLQVVLRTGEAQRPDGRIWQRDTVEGGRNAVIVIGSDRGLCGRFNDKIAAFASKNFLKTRDGTQEKPILCVMGLRAAARLSTDGHDANEIIGLPGSAGGLSKAAQQVITYIESLNRTESVTRVHLAHNSRTAGSGSTPVAHPILPVPPDYLEALTRKPWPSRSLPMFRMEGKALLEWLLRETIYVAVYRALAESLASEHASRLASMQNAEHNITERKEELLASFRRKRQESITGELLDLIVGYETSQQPQE